MAEAVVTISLPQYTADDLDGDDDALLSRGKHHIRIMSVKIPTGKDWLRLGYTVLASTAPENVGCASSEKFHLSESAKKRLAILANRLGWLNGADFSTAVAIDYSHAIRRELIVETIHETFVDQKGQNRTVTKWTFGGFWTPDDPRVANVPKAGQPQPSAQPTAGAGMADDDV
jgi:hypothetical protein